MKKLISQTAAWTDLKTHQTNMANVHMRDLFAKDNKRFSKFSLEACGLFLDYSKNRITDDTLLFLKNLAEEAQLANWIERMFNGEQINNTECRAALHVALRNRSNSPIHVDGKNVMPGVNEKLNKMRLFSDKVRSGEWLGYTGKQIESVINIGIGGSDLGPAMMTRALRPLHHPRLKSYFVSNVDATLLGETLDQVDPETTLFIVESKTFSTQETMLNAHSARSWLLEHLKDESAIAKHFVAVSTNETKVREFGIDTANMFEFWDWVGGRYSVWSAIGLPIAIVVGMDNFEKLLSGAHEMDKHFREKPFLENMPVIMGLIDVWYSSFFGASSQAILPYGYALELFPSYLQQLTMESLGKHVTREGKDVDYPTCPIVWGAPGNNGQHAFYQLLHQGTHLIPADVIISIESQHSLPKHQEAVLSNALAQTHAFMKGRNPEETRKSLEQAGVIEEKLEAQLPHRVFLGNQPSNTLVYEKLTPEVLGGLIALYEHKVFVQSVCWGINPFDQWGVELGKQVANSLLPELNTSETSEGYDSSTDGLLNYIKERLNKA